uniref:peptidyl-tRNA hydrolase n=1 Tax=uncultured organism TaxID=155900 RepID=M1PWI3_9ZZZZ|nr:aminoacyl-tRNA hydrolase [uncultured organism]
MKLYLIVGLGNPGNKYTETRHNVGFRAISALSKAYNIEADWQKYEALLGRGRIAGENIILAQPLTYMNNSGRSVKKLKDNLRIRTENLIIIYDDLDLPTGVIRIKKDGSSGGHNGLKSIIDSLNTENFPRIKIGIDHPGEKEEVVDYVLGKFGPEEEKRVKEAIDNVVEVVKVIIKNNFREAMNIYN